MMNLGQNIWQPLGKGKDAHKKSSRALIGRGNPCGDMHGALAAGRRIDDQQNDDPAAVAPTKVTLITAHKRTSYEVVGRSTDLTS